ALDAARKFKTTPTIFTKLGENITDLSEGLVVRDNYLELIDEIAERNLDVEISLKLTQLGFDLSAVETYERFKTITKKVKEKLGNVIWIDMEGSAYTQKTIEFYKKIKGECDNVGLCIQAYLYSTEKDIDNLLGINPNIRLVKGAYKEPNDIAFPNKKDVDHSYLKISKKLMQAAKEKNIRVAFGTHDEDLIYAIIKESKYLGLPKNKIEFQMLYGIKTNFQNELVKLGYKLKVLISYGEFWYPWYMRRLAERPSNVWFVLKNMF
ncbi:MAG: proline dehydrogenase, partial [Melioribacter sp.]|nr:proline dehydrogenase [Melioribacter sp.]